MNELNFEEIADTTFDEMLSDVSGQNQSSNEASDEVGVAREFSTRTLMSLNSFKDALKCGLQEFETLSKVPPSELPSRVENTWNKWKMVLEALDEEDSWSDVKACITERLRLNNVDYNTLQLLEVAIRRYSRRNCPFNNCSCVSVEYSQLST